MSGSVKQTFALMTLIFGVLTTASGCASKGEPTAIWQIDQLDQPESVVSGPDGSYLYISNINGQPMELNGKGYISRVTASGQITDRQWVTGLDAPKGMAIMSGKLYIADMKTLHVVDLKTAKIVKQFSAPNAKMLNDVTVSEDDTVYVSDLIGGGIYRLQNSTFSLWVDQTTLPHPNGLLWKNGKLLVASWGEGMQGDFTTRVPGTLYELDLTSKQLTPLVAGNQFGNLDGIVADSGSLYISDWITGDLYQLENNERRKVSKLPVGLADIGGSGNGILYAPLMMDNKVLALQL